MRFQSLPTNIAVNELTHGPIKAMNPSPPSPETAPEPIWAVVRLDDNGNHFQIAGNLPYSEAEKIVRQFEESGHKQCYWIMSNHSDQTAIGGC